jgi:hypothetical protein
LGCSLCSNDAGGRSRTERNAGRWQTTTIQSRLNPRPVTTANAAAEHVSQPCKAAVVSSRSPTERQHVRAGACLASWRHRYGERPHAQGWALSTASLHACGPEIQRACSTDLLKSKSFCRHLFQRQAPLCPASRGVCMRRGGRRRPNARLRAGRQSGGPVWVKAGQAWTAGFCSAVSLSPSKSTMPSPQAPLAHLHEC